MENILKTIEETCALYAQDKIDDDGFRKKIQDIPKTLWHDKTSAFSMLKLLMIDMNFYNVSLKQRVNFVPFLCARLPEVFWEQKDYMVDATEMIARFMAYECDGVTCSDFQAVFQHFPEDYWNDKVFVSEMTDLIVKMARAIEDLDSVSDLIPQYEQEDEPALRSIILDLFNEDERNAGDFSLYPSKAWEYPELVILMLSCLEDAIQNDRSWGSVYSNFRGSNAEYIQRFLDYVPDALRSNKEFILEFLGFEYFYDSFSALYNWVDQSFWADKDFVLAVLKYDIDAIDRISETFKTDKEFVFSFLKFDELIDHADTLYDWIEQELWSDRDFVLTVLELDSYAVFNVSESLATDEEFKTYVNENIDLSEVKRSFSTEKLPQWVIN